MISLIVKKKERKNSGFKMCDLILFFRLSLSIKKFLTVEYTTFKYITFLDNMHLYTMCETDKPDCSVQLD